MTWATFYLTCFASGFLFSLLSFLLGSVHFHLPHHVTGHARGAGSRLNPVTLAAFLAWFGGIGYLLTRFSSIWFVVGLGIAFLSGITGAGIIYLFLSRVLKAEAEGLEVEQFDMVGTLGRLSMPIRQGGTGELIYSYAGRRHTCGARAEDDAPIPKGTEVVVTRYEKGIAYVRLWTEMAGEPELNTPA
jgi:membrane protein implicated in regulation of membrane protease activity